VLSEPDSDSAGAAESPPFALLGNVEAIKPKLIDWINTFIVV